MLVMSFHGACMINMQEMFRDNNIIILARILLRINLREIYTEHVTHRLFVRLIFRLFPV